MEFYKYLIRNVISKKFLTSKSSEKTVDFLEAIKFNSYDDCLHYFCSKLSVEEQFDFEIVRYRIYLDAEEIMPRC